ncbi:hypothetical protein [Streptomyces sp. NPDC004284]|uniref:hypothetical protein n=1 Tax=Streptomyces sp. NPDC004284 TaxID=3364695 RepID=UPI003694AFD7
MADTALDGAGVPVDAQALDDGVPALEVPAGAALKDLRETADVRVKGLQLRTVGEDSGELLTFLR